VSPIAQNATQPGNREDPFDHDRAGQNARDRWTQERYHGQQRRGSAMTNRHHKLAQSFRAGRANEVLRECINIPVARNAGNLGRVHAPRQTAGSTSVTQRAQPGGKSG